MTSNVKDSMFVIKKLYDVIETDYLKHLAYGGEHNLETEHDVEALAYAWETLNHIDEVKELHGHWNRVIDNVYECSQCGGLISQNRVFYFCPICGAKMDK